jgi:hypothetical protein
MDYLNGVKGQNTPLTDNPTGNLGLIPNTAQDPVHPSGSILKGHVVVTDGFIMSGNFKTGVSGWQILANGDAEFNNITARGSIFATSGTIGGFVITATDIHSVTNNITIDSAGTITVGTTTGRHIIISGLTGRIEFYNAAGVLVAYVLGTTVGGQDSIDYFDGAGTLIAQQNMTNGSYILATAGGGFIAGPNGTIGWLTNNNFFFSSPGFISVSDPFEFDLLAADPAITAAGATYFNTTTLKLKFYDGAVWRTVTST